MGRYSSVQTYADNNAGMRKVPYEQATGGAAAASAGTSSSTVQKQTAVVQPEKVVNPYGSTAGAGSGDFHVYRHARNRELKRQHDMEQSAEEQEAEEKFQREQEDNRQWEEERTAKRRRKREREKNAKKRKENLAKAGIRVREDTAAVGLDGAAGAADEEFTYTPGEALQPLDAETVDSSGKKATRPHLDLPPNDGSFLEMMKKKLAQQQISSSSNNNNNNPETEQESDAKTASKDC